VLASAIWPCEFVAYGIPAGPAGSDYGGDQHMVLVQRWHEIQIRIPSENGCRPYGADKLQLDYDAIDGCDGTGQFLVGANVVGTIVAGHPVGYKWPHCNGMIFSNAAGIGGRLAITAIDSGGTITVDVAQPYLCLDWLGTTPVLEAVNVYDASMNLLGTATCQRTDSTHFYGFVSYYGASPAAAWITPRFRSDKSSLGQDTATVWDYADCDNYPKGHWVEELYSVDTLAATQIGSSSTSLKCATFSHCAPVWLRSVATVPVYGYTAVLAKVRQWEVSTFDIQKKVCCVIGTDEYEPRHRGYWPNNLSPCDSHDDDEPCYIQQFVESVSLGESTLPPQAGTDGTGCNAASFFFTPWNIWLCLSGSPCNLYPL
jgi:hypothetical protein